MAETHDYPTKSILAKNLKKSNVLVGESGGLSAVYETSATPYGKVIVTTEHGVLTFGPSATVNVYHEKRTASQIRDDIDTLLAAGETKEYVDPAAVWELIDELAEDLFDSIALAMGADHEDVEAVVTTVRDYYGNHYTN
jgi:hypothetical protein